MRIRYTDSLEEVDPADLQGFLAGWPTPPSPEVHHRMLAGSEAIVLAIDDDAGRRVVGFIHAIGDGVLTAFIPSLEVLPEYQGRGIGTELVRRLLARLDDRYSVDLVCDDDLVPFYERLGLQRWGAMIRRNRGAIAALNGTAADP